MANKWIGTIRLTEDAATMYTPDGKAVVKFNGACARTFKKDGQPDADFFSFVAFGKTAETIAKYVSKGMKILVDAEVRNNNWEKDGVKHYGTQMVVNSFEFCEKKGNAEAPASKDASDGFMAIPDGIDEELPFV